MARKSKEQNTTPKYLVGHDALGAFRRGEIVHADDLPRTADGDVDQDNIDRLVDLGALITLGGDEVSANDLTTQTLADAVRTDSPPTLPIVPDSVATSPQELALAVNPANTTVTGPLPDVE